MSWYQQLKNRVKASEGKKLQAYDDATGEVIQPGTKVQGYVTIGYGHNLINPGITEALAGQMLDEDLHDAVRSAEKIDTFHYLSDARKMVIVEMVFMMGLTGTLDFKNMWSALRQQNWGQAADEIMNSRMATQAPGLKKRAEELAEMMRSDTVIAESRDGEASAYEGPPDDGN